MSRASNSAVIDREKPGGRPVPGAPVRGRRPGLRADRWFIWLFSLTSGLIILGELALIFNVSPLLLRLAEFSASLHLSVVLSVIIGAGLVCVTAGCAWYRMRTRALRIVPRAPWGSFEGRYWRDGPPALPSSRSGTFWGRVVISVIIVVQAIALSFTTLMSWKDMLSSPVVLSYWLLASGTLLFCMIAFLIGRRFNHYPVAVGRVAAIVPAYDEDPQELETVVRSILGQSVPPAMVYVVDDGSKVPVGQALLPPAGDLAAEGERRQAVGAGVRAGPDGPGRLGLHPHRGRRQHPGPLRARAPAPGLLPPGAAGRCSAAAP